MTQLGPKMRVGLRVKELRAGLGVSLREFFDSDLFDG